MAVRPWSFTAGDSVPESDALAEPLRAEAAKQAAVADPPFAEAGRINAGNLRLTPLIPDRTIVCHIVTDVIIPAGQRNVLTILEQDMRSERFAEKVVALPSADSDSAEGFIKKLLAVKAREEARYPGYKVEFDVACPRLDLVDKVQRLGIQALAFSSEGGGDIVQVEGVILALRALRTGSAAALMAAYERITGKAIAITTGDVNEIARAIVFILPLRRLDANRIGALNRLIAEYIEAAA
jgi:hypothetical protein